MLGTLVYPMRTRRARPMAMAKREADDRGRNGGPSHDSRAGVDLPVWVATLMCVCVGVAFLVQVLRGQVDGGMYPLMGAALAGAVGVRSWRGRDL